MSEDSWHLFRLGIIEDVLFLENLDDTVGELRNETDIPQEHHQKWTASYTKDQRQLSDRNMTLTFGSYGNAQTGK